MHAPLRRRYAGARIRTTIRAKIVDMAVDIKIGISHGTRIGERHARRIVSTESL
jgi:hypothetical protein